MESIEHYGSSRTAVWLDGTGGQEDELEDVHKGILIPPTDDEAEGSLDESNGQGGVPDAARDFDKTDEEDLDALERRAGLRPM